ncbi:hypothetical protein QF012_000980 [Pseudomonas laurylsulfatiphila]
MQKRRERIAAFLFEQIICNDAIPVGAGLPAKAV